MIFLALACGAMLLMLAVLLLSCFSGIIYAALMGIDFGVNDNIPGMAFFVPFWFFCLIVIIIYFSKNERRSNA